MQRKTNRGLGSLAAVLAVLLVGIAGGASAALLNPGFESPNAAGGDVYGTDNWNCFNFVYTTAAVAHSGLQSLKTFGPFAQSVARAPRKYCPRHRVRPGSARSTP